MPRDDAPFKPTEFDLGPPRQLVPNDGVQEHFLFGYYELERAERFATFEVVNQHRDLVTLWYRLLSAYYRALDVPRVISDDDVWVTVWKILRLGLVAAKGALDATMAGYYVGAFGDIRQLSEYWFGIDYLVHEPASVNGFYAAAGEQQYRLPSMGQRIRAVIDDLSPGGARPDPERLRFAQLVRGTYRRMSDGHHLDGLALVQTGDPDDPGYFLGATYSPGLLNEAFHHGARMTATMGLKAAVHMAALNPAHE